MATGAGTTARALSRCALRRRRRVQQGVALLILVVLGLAACLPVASAWAVFSKQVTVTANTMSAAAAFPRCYSDAVTADNPVSYWRLDETSGTSAADSKGSNTGTYTNGPTLGQAGALPDVVNNKAASFNVSSSQYVSVPYSAALNPNQLTVEAWVYTTSVGAGPTVAGSWYQSGSSNKGYWIGTNTDSANNKLWDFQVGYDTGYTDVFGPVVTLNTWTHMVGTYDGTTARFYVNGTLVGSAASSYLANPSSPFGIGSWYSSSAGWTDFWPGRIDDVSVYSSALTAAQVRTHYNAGRCYKDGVLADNPTGYWRLGESSGTTAADGIRGRHGTYVGTPTLAATGALNGDANTAVTLNGTSQYVTAPYDAALNPSQVTLEAWAKPTGGAGTARTVIASQDTNKGYLLGIGTDDKWRFTIGTGVATTVITGPAVTLNSWAHIVGTYDGTTATLYVDGLSVGTAAVSVSVNTTRALGIGATNAGGSWAGYFPGSLDDPALYSSALSEARVQAHYLLGRSYKDTVLDSGPVSYWRLGEGSGTSAADSKGTNTGTYTNGPTLAQAGALAADADTSTSFDGTNDNVNIPYSAGLNTAQFTLEAWVKVTGGSGTYRAPVDSWWERPQNNPPFKGYGIWITDSDAWWPLAGYSSGFAAFTGPSVIYNAWTHLVETFDGTTLKLYVNGTLGASGTVTGYTANDAAPLLIGSSDYGSGPTEPFPGRIDDVAVYNRELSATEIQLHYDSGRQ